MDEIDERVQELAEKLNRPVDTLHCLFKTGCIPAGKKKVQGQWVKGGTGMKYITKVVVEE